MASFQLIVLKQFLRITGDITEMNVVNMKKQNSITQEALLTKELRVSLVCLYVAEKRFPSSMHFKQVKTNLNMAAQSLNRLSGQDKLLVSP